MHFYLAVNRQKDPGLTYSQGVADYIRTCGSTAEILSTNADEFGNYHFDFINAAKPAEDAVVLVLGGDGTFLQCTNDLNLCHVDYPLIGINLGTLGFLTQVEREDINAAIDTIIAGEYTLEPMPLLSASIDNDRLHYCEQATNDVVIGRDGFARVITLDVSIDGNHVFEARCDGLIVCTAAGSTAYNISLGGPVVPPGTPVFVVNPIAPHLPGLRPVIVPETSVVTVKIHASRGNDHDGLLTCDGRSNGIWLERDEVVTIQRHSFTARRILLNNSRRGFYDIFRDKLLTVK